MGVRYHTSVNLQFRAYPEKGVIVITYAVPSDTKVCSTPKDIGWPNSGVR